MKYLNLKTFPTYGNPKLSELGYEIYMLAYTVLQLSPYCWSPNWTGPHGSSRT